MPPDHALGLCGWSFFSLMSCALFRPPETSISFFVSPIVPYSCVLYPHRHLSPLQHHAAKPIYDFESFTLKPGALRHIGTEQVIAWHLSRSPWEGHGTPQSDHNWVRVSEVSVFTTKCLHIDAMAGLPESPSGML